MSHVLTERRSPGVEYLILDQPETRNALSDELLDELLAALAAAAALEEPAVDIEGKVFVHCWARASGSNPILTAHAPSPSTEATVELIRASSPARSCTRSL